MNYGILLIVFLPLLAAFVAGLGNRALGNTRGQGADHRSAVCQLLRCAWPIFLSFVAGTAEAQVVPVLHWVQSGSLSFDWACASMR